MGTLVERISRYTMRVKLDGNTAQDVLEGCPRRSTSDPPCRSNSDPGMDAARVLVGCG